MATFSALATRPSSSADTPIQLCSPLILLFQVKKREKLLVHWHSQAHCSSEHAVPSARICVVHALGRPGLHYPYPGLAGQKNPFVHVG